MPKPEPPNRKLPRLKSYDYAQTGSYFVTICSYRHSHLFGDVIQESIQLNELGQIAASCWLNIPTHFSHVRLDLYVIMPNHMHGIVVIDETETTDHVGKRHTFSAPTTLTASKSVQPGSLGAIIGSYKSAVTRQINHAMGIKAPMIWQGSYHDHIIRNEVELNFIRNYVLNNPAKWSEDKYYSDISKP